MRELVEIVRRVGAVKVRGVLRGGSATKGVESTYDTSIYIYLYVFRRERGLNISSAQDNITERKNE